MTKYTSEFKAQIIHEYQTTSMSSRNLAHKYHIDDRLIRSWVNAYRAQGVNALKPRHGKRAFSADFKLNVIDYYQTHEASMAETAAKYDLLPSQISIWRSQFKRGGIEALKPHSKGRPSKVKHSKKQLRHRAQQAELDRLKEELAQKNQELYDMKLERDILKKSLTLFGPSKPERKRK